MKKKIYKYPLRPKGYKFGAWRVLYWVTRYWNRYYKVKCICGKAAFVDQHSLEYGYSNMCLACAGSRVSGAQHERLGRIFILWCAKNS